MQNNLKIKGSYEFQIFDTKGNLRDSWKVDNLVVNGGLALISGLVAGTGTAPSYIAVGTSSTAVAGSQTTLEAEITDTGLERAEGSVSRTETNVANDTYRITYIWEATGSKTIEEVGVFNDPTTGTMLSRALTTSKAIANGESLIGTYSLSFINE
jgi:hypothetical protein